MALGVFCHLNHHRILLCAKLGSGGVERVRARLKGHLRLTFLFVSPSCIHPVVLRKLCCLFLLLTVKGVYVYKELSKACIGICRTGAGKV